MRANDTATMQEIPTPLMAIGACSRELPCPKFSPATSTSPGAMRCRSDGSRSSKTYLASSAGSVVTRYRAGMMTSVSIWCPTVCALPRIAMAVLDWHRVAHDLVGMHEFARHRRGGRDRCVAEIHLAAAMSHPAYEIATAGGHTHLPVGQDPHVPADAWSACRGAEGRARVEKDLHQPLVQRLAVDGRGRGNDQQPGPGMDLPPGQDPGRQAHVFDAPVGAGADEALVHLHAPYLAHRHDVAGRGRRRHDRIQGGHADLAHLHVARAGVAPVDGDRPASTGSYPFQHHIVGLNNAVLRPGLNGHSCDIVPLRVRLVLP